LEKVLHPPGCSQMVAGVPRQISRVNVRASPVNGLLVLGCGSPWMQTRNWCLRGSSGSAIERLLGPVFDAVLFLLCQFAEYLAQMPQFPVQRLSAVLPDEHHMVFSTPTSYGSGFPSLPSQNSVSCALVAHASEFPRWTPVSVKPLVLPRQSRGPPVGTRLVQRCDSVRTEMRSINRFWSIACSPEQEPRVH
jgi:hypothetical protein